MGLVYMTKMLDADLSANQMRMALWLSVKCKKGNIIVVTSDIVKKELGIDRHQRSKIMAILVERDLVKRGEARSVYYVNPQWCWYGNATDHRIACSKWHSRIIPITRTA